MEVTGVVLGGIPILLYALDNYKRFLEPGKNYLHYSSTLSAIRSHVFVQQEQLDVTLRNIGLIKPSKAELRDHLWGLYPPEKCLEFMNIIEEMEKTINRMMEKLDIDLKTKPPWSAGNQERVNWEWRRIRRSFGRKERDRLIAELQYWNTSLKNIFERSEIPSDESNPLLVEMHARFNSKQCDTLRQNLQLIHETLSGRWSCACAEHKGNIRLEWHDSKTALTDEMTLIMPSGQEDRWHTLCVNCHTVVEGVNTQPLTPSSTTTTQVGTDASRSPSQTVKSRPPSPSRLKKLKVLFATSQEKKRRVIEHLANAMTPTSSYLDSRPENEISCLCLFTRPTAQPKRAGYIPCSNMEGALARQVKIECVPPGSGMTTATCIPLHHFLSPTLGKQSPSPVSTQLSRKQRFSVAASIVWGLLYLCDSPWMGKDWSGKDLIRLFTQPGTPGQETQQERSRDHPKQELEYPALGYTFKPRPEGPQPTTPDPTRDGTGAEPDTANPADFQRNQIRNKDLFSLGILLIELCLNKTFDQIRCEESVARGRSFSATLAHTPQLSALGWSSPPETWSVIDDFELANKQIDKIYLEAGDSYGYAVQRCLRCEFPGRDVTKSFNFQQFRQNFFNGVVAPVQATWLMQPGSLAGM